LCRCSFAFERRRENRAGLGFRAILCRHVVQAVVGKPAAVCMKKIVLLLESLEKTFEGAGACARSVAQSLRPFLESLRLIHAQGVVRAERWKYFHLPARLFDGLVMFEVVGRIVRRA